MSQLYLRLPEALHSKLRVIAALKRESLNTTVMGAANEYVAAWEAKHGELPTPPEDA